MTIATFGAIAMMGWLGWQADEIARSHKTWVAMAAIMIAYVCGAITSQS